MSNMNRIGFTILLMALLFGASCKSQNFFWSHTYVHSGIDTCFGYLYNWYAVDDSRELTSSADWSVPTSSEWNGLCQYVDEDAYYMRSSSEVFWDVGLTGIDSYGFNAKGSGNRGNINGAFSNLKNYAKWWSSTEDGVNGADICHTVSLNSFIVPSGYWFKKNGDAIRLVKDATGLPDGITTTYTGNDGKTYNAVVINELYWTTENLEETQYRNGDYIPNVEDNTIWANLTTGALCLYDNDANNACNTPTPCDVFTECYSNCDEYVATGDYYDLTGREPLPQGVWFKPDGMIMYHVGSGNDYIYQHSLTIAWDVTTVQAPTDSFRLRTQFVVPNDMYMSDDGASIWIIGSTNDIVAEYTLSTPWDLGTIGHTQSYSLGDGYWESVAFSDDGTQMYTAKSDSNVIVEYSLSSAFDISTASISDSIDISVDLVDGSSNGIQTVRFCGGGNIMYVLGTTSVSIHNILVYELSTAYDVTTASLVKVGGNLYSIDAVLPQSFFFNGSDQMFLVTTTTDAIREFIITQ